MTEKEKMLSGQLYDACDRDLLKELNEVKVKCQQYNNLLPTDFAERNTMLQEMLGRADQDTFINQPFYCDYGFHIEVGKDFFANYNCTIIDVAKVTIGDNCLLAPNVAIYTAGHPIHPDTRRSMYEYGKPVTIGDNVWIGGNAVILPGVTIGSARTSSLISLSVIILRLRKAASSA